MPRLKRIAMKEGREAAPDAPYPFSVPAVQHLVPLDVHVGVTFFVGENGSGKSTLLEGIAASAELPALGHDEIAVDDSLVHARALGACLRLSWEERSRQGFFLRAEDFFGYHRAQARTTARIIREKRESDVPQEELVARWVAAMGAGHPDEAKAGAFIAHHDSRSHGESFIDRKSVV